MFKTPALEIREFRFFATIKVFYLKCLIIFLNFF
jgi:hypothetical protein